MGLGKGFFDVATNATQITTSENGLSVEEALYQGGISENYSEVIVYVGSGSTLLNGNDTTGDGTIENPYATINKALEVAPSKWFRLTGSTNLTPSYYRVRILSGSKIASSNVSINSNGFGVIPTIFIEGWSANTASFGTTSDERFVILSGALSVVSASTFQSRARYTLGPGVIASDEQWQGEMVRVYSASVEVERGWVVRTTNSTQELLMHGRNTRNPTSEDVLYIVRPSAQLGGETPAISRYNLNGVALSFHTIRCVDATTFFSDTTIRITQAQLVANGGSGAVNCEQVAGGFTFITPSTSTNFTPGGSSYPGNDTTLGAGGCAVRIGGGFCITGPALISGGGLIIGNLFAPTGPNIRALEYRDNSFHRGGILPQSRPNNLTVAILGSVDGPRPTLWMPYQVTNFMPLIEGAQFNAVSINSTYVDIAVDVGSMQGTLIPINNGRGIGYVKFIPADAAVTGSNFFLVDVQADGVFGVQQGTSIVNTTIGTSGVFKAGDTAAQTPAALFALSGSRITDTFRLASVKSI